MKIPKHFRKIRLLHGFLVGGRLRERGDVVELPQSIIGALVAGQDFEAVETDAASPAESGGDDEPARSPFAF